VAIVYPTSIDVFSVPSLPEDTSLSSAGTSTRDHTQSHADLGNAVMALETNASPLAHDHSDGDTENATWPTPQLAQVNTHQSPDTDTAVMALHHTLGTTATQAAAGNHAHDYEGSSIFNKPLVICTSTTRPLDPAVGEMIWETDTNIVRAWSQFPNNTLVTSGIAYTYNFDSNNNADTLDTILFDQDYLYGNDSDGFMGAPGPHNWFWTRGNNNRARCFARSIHPTYGHFATDDCVIEFTTGELILQERYLGGSPCNDFYLRCSDDGLDYVRFQLFDEGVCCFYAIGGYQTEILLGQVSAFSLDPNANWLCKAIGNTYVLYANGVQVIAVVDYEQVVRVDSGHRGWGLGMCAEIGLEEQLIPANVYSITIYDLPYYTSELIWQLLPVASVPHLRAEAHFTQQIIVGGFGRCGFDTILWDWPFRHFMDVSVSQTDITIPESGHYTVHASICWDPGFPFFDHAMVGITVNGVDIGRKNWEFMRGNGFFPGFAQTNEIHFTYYFAQGDVLQIQAQHNAPVPCWLFWFFTSPNIQTCYVELDFLGA
jgi:hypothetical protein